MDAVAASITGARLAKADRALARGARLGRWFGRVARYHRGDATVQLARSFPDRTPRQIAGIVDGMYAHLGRNIAESFVLRDFGEPYARARVEWVGRDILDRCRAGGRGVCVATAHLGNWELLCTATPIFGLPLTIVVKAIKNARLNAFINRTRAQFGLTILPSRGSYRACLRALRGNQLLGFVLDQNMIRTEGAFVEFFGRPACTTLGLAHMAARAGAPVVPVFSVRLPDNRHRIVVQEPLDPPADTEEETLRAATQEYTRRIEVAVRAHPEQWIWLHRRWRTVPGDRQPVGQSG